MAQIVVFHFTDQARMPKMSPEKFGDVVEKFSSTVPDVRLKRVYVDEDGMGFCEWEAPDPDAVREVVKQVLGRFPIDPVIAVKQLL